MAEDPDRERVEDELSIPGVPEPEEQPRIPKEVAEVPEEGLEPRPGARKRVVIIGAGMAGLVAAYELKRQGHDPIILEAQYRVGGRVWTCRDFAPGLYAEYGAMRIPRIHDLTLGYCDEFGLELRPFVMGNPKTLLYVERRRMTMEEADRDPSLLPFELAEHERGRTYTELWEEATSEIREVYEREGKEAFDALLTEYDKFSIREFLQSRGFSEGAIELYGVMSFRESNMNSAVIEQLREITGQAYEDMQEIVGGLDLLPQAFYEQIREHVRFGAEVHALQQDADGVRVHYRTHAGRFTETGDYAICAIPFSVLRDMEVEPSFTRGKQKAIRELNYNPSTKVLFQTRSRFWEQSDGIVGGTTTTDLPIRRMCYPSFSDPEEERGTLLASYTWGQDASRWAGMDPETRIEQAIEDVAKIHPEVVDDFEVGASHAWYNDPWQRGAFALFEPEQNTRLQHDIEKPEGRIHFAGEHCSLWHAWIQGALESGIRAAKAIHETRAEVAAARP